MQDISKKFWIIAEEGKLTIRRTKSSLLRMRIEMAVGLFVISVIISWFTSSGTGNKRIASFLFILLIFVSILSVLVFRQFFDKGFSIARTVDGFLINSESEMPSEQLLDICLESDIESDGDNYILMAKTNIRSIVLINQLSLKEGERLCKIASEFIQQEKLTNTHSS
jgi:hypothetical protein